MRFRLLTAVLVGGLLLGSFAIGNYAVGQSSTKTVKWKYTIIKHSPYLTESGSDFKNIQALGDEGWELASSYPVKGEIVISIFKRQK
ncbi:MAG: hypothetical protein O2954_00485 [bacterium]|nr:hypothetical protein [bacterium]